MARPDPLLPTDCRNYVMWERDSAAREGAGSLVNPAMMVRFWGVRGSIACPGPATMRYGGNTSCVEVRCGGQLFVFDSGSGIRQLGDALMKGVQPRDFDLFYT